MRVGHASSCDAPVNVYCQGAVRAPAITSDTAPRHLHTLHLSHCTQAHRYNVYRIRCHSFVVLLQSSHAIVHSMHITSCTGRQGSWYRQRSGPSRPWPSKRDMHAAAQHTARGGGPSCYSGVHKRLLDIPNVRRSTQHPRPPFLASRCSIHVHRSSQAGAASTSPFLAAPRHRHTSMSYTIRTRMLTVC